MAEIGVMSVRLRGGGDSLRFYVGRLAAPVAWTTGDGLAEHAWVARWGDGRATPLALSGQVALFCSEHVESDGHRDHLSAVPDDAGAIRHQLDNDEPPALIFNDEAAPGALVSWAWSQLKALDAMLTVLVETRARDDGEPDFAAAVRTVLVPVINALEFSEWCAGALRQASPARGERKGKGDAAGKKHKKKPRV